MKIQSPKLSESFAFVDRTERILRGECRSCALAETVIRRAIIDDGVVYHGVTACRRLGNFIGKSMTATELSDCNGDSCCSVEEVEQLGALDSPGEFDEEVSAKCVELAMEIGTIDADDLIPNDIYDF